MTGLQGCAIVAQVLFNAKFSPLVPNQQRSGRCVCITVIGSEMQCPRCSKSCQRLQLVSRTRGLRTLAGPSCGYFQWCDELPPSHPTTHWCSMYSIYTARDLCVVTKRWYLLDQHAKKARRRLSRRLGKQEDAQEVLAGAHGGAGRARVAANALTDAAKGSCESCPVPPAASASRARRQEKRHPACPARESMAAQAQSLLGPRGAEYYASSLTQRMRIP